MKKLLATLVLSLGLATVASAQSSVTIYGLLDVGYQGRNIKGSPSTATNTFNSDQFASGAQSGSRLGFRGVEDLGGGTTAFFTVETGVTPTSTTVSTWFNRQSFVGIGQKGLGNMAIGTQYGPIWKAQGLTDPGQQNNTIGSIIFPQAGTDGGQAQFDAAYTGRFANSLTATTERFKGFSANALYALNNTNSAQTGATTGGTNNNNAYGLGLDYSRGAFYAVVAYQNLKSEVTSNPTASITNWVGTNTTDNQLYAAATYQLKSVKLFANYIDRQLTSNLNSNQFLSRSGQQIGARGYVTKRVEGWASAGNGRYQAFGVNNPTANFTAYQVGANYWMSKRTNLYAIAGSTQTSSTSAGALSGNMYATGIRHTF